jgi:hypothetical protein
MRRLIAYLDPLILGMILGMIFVAVAHASPSHWQEKARATGITVRCEHICYFTKE